MNRKAFLLGILVIGGCGAESVPPSAPPPGFVAEVKLAAQFPADAKLTGVAVSPEGKTYVLDQRSGLYQLDGSTARLVFSLEDISTRVGLSPAPELTDVVALGDERFALTAENDGYLLDLHNRTFVSYFCYLPAAPAPGAGAPAPEVVSVSTQYRNAGIAVKQHTDAVAFSRDNLQLFAQPQTIRLDTGAVVGSEVFAFPQGGGQPSQVTAMAELDFLAGGMLAVGGQSLLLGVHDRIYRATPNGAPTFLWTLATPIEIAGMARATDGNVLLLDGPGRRLLEATEY